MSSATDYTDLPRMNLLRSVYPWHIEAPMQKKIFWLTFIMLSALATIVLPFWWSVAATVPILLICWWVVYRSEWF